MRPPPTSLVMLCSALAAALAGCPSGSARWSRGGGDGDGAVRPDGASEARGIDARTVVGLRTRFARSALGDGTLAGELLAAARRVLGLRFAPGSDVALADEQAAFEAHLSTVAVWGGARAPGRGTPGDLWQGREGALAVIEAGLGAGRWRVIGPVAGPDGVRVRSREVRGGQVWRAVLVGSGLSSGSGPGSSGQRVGLAGGGQPR